MFQGETVDFYLAGEKASALNGKEHEHSKIAYRMLEEYALDNRDKTAVRAHLSSRFLVLPILFYYFALTFITDFGFGFDIISPQAVFGTGNWFGFGDPKLLKNNFFVLVFKLKKITI